MHCFPTSPMEPQWSLERAYRPSDGAENESKETKSPGAHGAPLNSHPVNAPYMAQLVMLTFELRNRNWG